MSERIEGRPLTAERIAHLERQAANAHEFYGERIMLPVNSGELLWLARLASVGRAAVEQRAKRERRERAG